MKTIHITDHAKERYVERIMNAEKVDIPRMVDQYNDKIYDDITKMVKFGDLVYTGINPAQKHRKNNTLVNIYLCNNWIVILDVAENLVITLYEKDCEDTTVKAMFDEYYAAKTAAKAIGDKLNPENAQIISEIKENDLKMQQLSAEITRLRSTNNRLRKQMDSNYGKIKGAEIKATQLFERIVTKQR